MPEQVSRRGDAPRVAEHLYVRSSFGCTCRQLLPTIKSAAEIPTTQEPKSTAASPLPTQYRRELSLDELLWIPKQFSEHNLFRNVSK